MEFNLIIDDSITIEIRYHDMLISIVPEYPQMFEDSKLIDNIHSTVEFNSHPSNGSFTITLDDNFTFELCKSGNGRAGVIVLSVPRTYKMSQDFSNVVKEISEYLKN